MGKNGGKPEDAILTLEEALKRFKRKRSEAGVQTMGEKTSDSNVHHADFKAKREGERATTELEMAATGGIAIAQRDDAEPAGNDIVAVIEGIPRTLEQLEQLAAAELAYKHDFPDDSENDLVVEEEDDSEPIPMDTVAMLAARHAMRRDYAFAAMGTALMLLVAVLVTHGPGAMRHQGETLMAQSIASPALKASSSLMNAANLITTLVIVPPMNEELASAGMPKLKTDKLEAKIKDTLKNRAFTDIGVSVSSNGTAYLAGEVYSLNEARKISHIVQGVNGVTSVRFLHPDVVASNGPAYFGVTTAWAPSTWGAKVKSVMIGSPADKAGLKTGDVISEFDGKTIPDGKSLSDLMSQYAPGQRVEFRAWHNGRPEYLVARLGELQTVASR